jgi:outer membrane protein assembly factor BamB
MAGTFSGKSYESISVNSMLDERTARGMKIVSIIPEIAEGKNFIWKIGVGGSIATNPQFHDGLVIFGSFDKSVYGVQRLNGELVWKFTTGGPVSYMGPVASGRLYFGCYDGNLYCLDAGTGELIWKREINSKIAVGPSMFGRFLYVGAENGRVYKLTTDGEPVWTFATKGPIMAYPWVHKGKVYIGSWDWNIYCLDDDDGSLVWRFPTGGMVQTSPMIFEDVVCFGSYDKNVYGLSPEDGRLLWKTTFNGIVGNTVNAVTKDGIAYVGAMDDVLYAIDMRTGHVAWKYIAGGIVISSTSDKGILYLGCFDYCLYAISESSRKLLWKFYANGLVNSVIKVHDGVVYAGSWDGNMYAIRLDGTLLWKFATSLDYQAVPEGPEEEGEVMQVVAENPETREEEGYKNPVEGKAEGGTYLSLSGYRLDSNVYSPGGGMPYVPGPMQEGQRKGRPYLG